MKNYNSIIIGSGLGGLIAGATLALWGKKVIVLEQHYIAGGCATAFKRKDYLMEVGLHEIDGLHETDPKRPILELLGVFDEVEFLKVPFEEAKLPVHSISRGRSQRKTHRRFSQ